MHVGRPKVKEADSDFSFAAAFNLLHPALGRLCFRQAATETTDVDIDRLPESGFVVPGLVAGAGRCRSGVCHDRTIHTFDSHRNAIWVGDFSAH
jgi:hypothetical protein